MIQNTPIQKLEADIQQCSSLLEQAKLDLKIANSRDQKIMSIRIQTRINYFERRISVSKSELNRFKALYSMSVEEQTKARLISANKFDMSLRGAERRGNLTTEEQVSELTDILNLYKAYPVESRSLSGVEVKGMDQLIKTVEA